MIPQKIIIILIFLTLKMTCRKTLYIPGVTLNTHLDQSLTELPFESPTLIVNDLSSLGVLDELSDNDQLSLFDFGGF